MGVRFFLTQPIYSEDAIEKFETGQTNTGCKNTGRLYANC